MPSPGIARPVKGVKEWVSKSDQLAQVFAPFATDAAARVASDKGSRGDAGGGTRIAVAANLHDVLGLQAFAQPPQAAATPEADDALLEPFVW